MEEKNEKLFFITLLKKGKGEGGVEEEKEHTPYVCVVNVNKLLFVYGCNWLIRCLLVPYWIKMADY